MRRAGSECGTLGPARSILDSVRFNGVGGTLLPEAVVVDLDCVRFRLLLGFALDSAISILDCVRLSLFVSGFATSGFEGDFLSGWPITGLKRDGSARNAEGWLAIESIFLNCFICTSLKRANLPLASAFLRWGDTSALEDHSLVPVEWLE